MLRIRLCLFFVLLFSGTGLWAQEEWNRTVDSLSAATENAPNDSDRAKAFNLLANTYSSIDLEKAIAYNRQALELAKKCGAKSVLADGYNTAGVLYSEQGKNKEAFFCFDASVGLAQELGDKTGVAKAYLNASSTHYALGEYDIALELSLKSLALYEETGDVLGVLDSYVNVANIYAIKKEYTPAKFYHHKALEGYRKMKDKVGQATTLANLAGIFKSQEQSDSALVYFEETARVCENENMPYYLAVAWEGLGAIYGQKNDFAKAHRYLSGAYALYQEIGVNYRCASTLAHHSDVYFREKNYPLAIEYGLRTLDMSLEYNESELIRVAYGLLYKAYAAAGNYPKAYDYHVKYTDLRDSLFSQDNQQHLNELRTQFETEEKEKENKILANENHIQNLELNRNRYYVGGLIILLLGGVAVGWLLIRQYRLRTQQKAMELEQKLLRSQMNPHFIFNSLNSIESFIYEHQPREAGLYLSKFAKLMRLILESSAREYVPLEKETEMLEYYLNLQKLRMHDHFDYHIEVDEALLDDEVNLPPMLTQPFIENAIEHGIKGNTQKGNILVRFSRVGESLQIEIRDNGIGIQEAANRRGNSGSHKSMAMDITRERLLFLNKSKKQRLRFEVNDLSDGANGETGTHIVFTVPLA